MSLAARFRTGIDMLGKKILNVGGGTTVIPDLGAYLDKVAKLGPDGRLVQGQAPAAGFGLTFNATTNAYEFNDNALNFAGGGAPFTDKQINPATGQMVTKAGWVTFPLTQVSQGTTYRSNELSLYYAAFYNSQGTSGYLRAWSVNATTGAPQPALTTVSPTQSSATGQEYLMVSLELSDVQFLHVAPTQGYDDTTVKLRLGATTTTDAAAPVSTVTAKLAKASNLSDLVDKAAARKNLGITDTNDKVPASLLPGFVDDIQEFDGGASTFPPVGERGIQYVDTSNGGYIQYRWSGTAYGAIIASPGTTDAVVEGVKNLYFTAARAIGSLLTGYVKAAAIRAIVATDSVRDAIGILEAKADSNNAAIAAINGLIPANATPGNQLITRLDIPANTFAPIVQAFDQQTVVDIAHGRGRIVAIQIYETDGRQTLTDVLQVDLLTVRITFDEPTSGNIIVI